MNKKINPKDAKRIEKAFTDIRFIPRKIPNTDLKYYGDWDFDEQPPRQELFGFVNQPIIVKNENNGDVYQVYYKKRISAWDFKDVIQNENEALIIDKQQYLSEYFYIELVKKGTTFGLTSETIDSSDLSYSEFAKFEKFEDVDAPNYSVVYADNPQVSESSFFDGIEKLTDQQIKKSLSKLNEEDNKLINLLKAKEDGTLKSAMWTIDEIDNIYNTKLSEQDKRSWVIYLQNKAKKKLEGEFIKKYDSEYPANPETILELMKSGSLFYDPNSKVGERLQPRSVYRSGNIWLKKSSLDNEKDLYVKRFGEELYEMHKNVLQDVWLETWDNRLKLKSKDKENRLVLLPISALADTFKIESFISPSDRTRNLEDFVVGIKRKKGEIVEDVSELGIGNVYYGDNNLLKKNVISLKEGFIAWCKEAGSGNKSSELGINWSNTTKNIGDVITRYLKPTNNPFKQEKNGEMKWERYKDDARKVGNRLFAQFLSDGLSKKDQQKIEIIFNSTYNYDVPIKLDEVPIGFTYKKYLDNKFLFVLRDSNLNAIRNYVYKGSIGLAYGVGLGKTFCSIFIMKQALDLGLVKRPIVIVPNQVYSQFINEISRGLGKDFNPNMGGNRINGFYNGQGELYNRLGNNAVDGINICTYEATKNFVYDAKRIEGNWFEEASLILESGNENSINEQRQEYEDKYSKTNFLDVFDVNTDVSEKLVESDEDIINKIDDDFDDFDLLDDDDLIEFEDGGEIESELEPIEFPIFINSESNDFDMVVVDEAHNFNALFSKVQAPVEEGQEVKKRKDTGKLLVKRGKSPYGSLRETSSGRDSKRAEKLWFLARYIQSKSILNNTILLSATPFTNSPLQVFSMISYINYEMLKNSEIGNLKDFFDVFAKIEFAEDFKTDLSIVKRNKLVGWTNVVALQKFVFYVFDKSSREDEDKAVVRPNKIVLPLKQQLIDGKVYQFDKENYVSTTIKMSLKQQKLWNIVRDYASGKENPITGNKITFSDIAQEENLNTTSFIPKTKKKAKKEDDDNTIDIDNPDDLADGTTQGEKDENTAKALQCLMWGRQITLNPYLYKWSGFKQEPKPKEYVEQSPKLLYTMLCIKSVKEYHDKSKDSPYMSGQVIYMNFGVKAFRLLRDYLVEELGFNYNEIGIISGKGNFIGKKLYQDKQMVADAFLGRKFNEKTKSYDKLEEKDRCKILIGSEAIKEGINLQNYASVLYNCFLDFNPTDTIQVEGRIWRQGNAFANVRIVTPLISDSIDIFMFQKLEDKTERINQIWTRNGNRNEIDTTSFNPADLKYELVNDPKVIAELEREYKKEQIDTEITDLGEIISSYLNLKSLFTEKDKIIDRKLNNRDYNDWRYSMYYNISQMRCDLLDKPLLKEDYYLEILKKYANNNQMDYEELLRYRPTIYSFTEIWDGAEYLNKNNISIDSFFNYSVDDLIKIMATLLKEQKIAYPYGYSPNWRDLIPKQEIPIIEGEEVEFDTKKGRKKGVSEFVTNGSGSNILSTLFLEEIFSKEFIDYLNEKIKDKNVKDLLIKRKDNEDYVFNRNQLKEKYIEENKNELIQLFKTYYQFNFDNKYNMGSGYLPKTLDVGVVEDISIEEKNVKAIRDEKNTEENTPLETPKPFSFSSKKLVDNLIEIYTWTNEYYYKYLQNPILKQQSKDYDIIKSKFLYLDPKQNFINYENTLYNSAITMITGENNYFLRNAIDINETIESSLKDQTWANLMDSSFKEYLFQVNDNNLKGMYEVDFPAKLKEFDLAVEKRLKPMGIETKNQLQELIDEKQVEINTLKLDQKNLDDGQYFDELVQEVVRRMEELNSEEVRAGSSFIARAESFAKANPDYKGNELLSIFRKDIETDKKSKTKKKEVVEEVIEIEESNETNIESINEEIQALESLLEIYEKDDKEYKEVTELINGLKDLKEIYE